jgi:hypothetical protein
MMWLSCIERLHYASDEAQCLQSCLQTIVSWHFGGAAGDGIRMMRQGSKHITNFNVIVLAVFRFVVLGCFDVYGFSVPVWLHSGISQKASASCCLRCL